MSDIKLGPSGAQVTLPDLVWPDGSAPELPYEQDGGAEESRMLDGSIRVNFMTYAPGTWPLVWDGLVWSDVETIWGAAVLNAALVYTNEYTDNTDHAVYVQSRSYALKAGTAGATARYVVNVTLRELIGG